jgi:hypothetical protein
MESFTLGLLLKIDFTRIVEHTLTKARELANLQISLNTLSKQMEFYTEFLQNNSLKPSIYRLTKNLILINFGCWQVTFGWSLSCFQTVFYDRLSRIA